MLKKIIITFFISTFVISCGYTPMYTANSELNFNFKEINISGDSILGDMIETNLLRYKKSEDGKEILLDVNINYEKLSQTKDAAGNTTDYLLVAEVEFIIKKENTEKKVNIKKDFVMENIEKEFEEKNYERSIKQNFAYSIVNKLIFQLSKEE